jgi:hypothetical protein
MSAAVKLFNTAGRFKVSVNTPSAKDSTNAGWAGEASGVAS